MRLSGGVDDPSNPATNGSTAGKSLDAAAAAVRIPSSMAPLSPQPSPASSAAAADDSQGVSLSGRRRRNLPTTAAAAPDTEPSAKRARPE